jgi:hypothetical protein
MGQATSVVPTRDWHALGDGRVRCERGPYLMKLTIFCHSRDYLLIK